MRFFVSVVFVGLLSACASVDVVRTKEAPAKPKDCVLRVYSSAADVRKPHESVCSLGTSTGSWLFTDKSLEHAIDNARPAACACGGDAMIINHVSSEGMSLTGSGKSAALINVIRYTPEK